MTNYKDKNFPLCGKLKNKKAYLRNTNNASVPLFVCKKKKKTTKKKRQFIESESYKKKTFVHRMKNLGILIFLAIFTGSGLGVWYYNTMLRSNVDYDTLYAQADTYIANYDKIFLDNFAFDTPPDKGWVEDAHAQGKTPASLSAIDNFALAEWNSLNSSSFSAIGNGVVSTMGVNQTVYSEKLFDGNAYTFASVCSGLITVTSLDYYQKGSNKASIYAGTVNNNGINWKLDNEMPFGEYQDFVGTRITSVHPYIISNKTVLSASEITFDDMSGNYTFTLELDCVLSVIRYARQVKKTGGLGSYPEFSRVTQTITIDNNWNLVSIDIEESYSAIAYGMKVGCSAHLLYDFTFDDNIVLPV